MRECSRGDDVINNNINNSNNHNNVDEETEVCADYNVRYENGDPETTVSGVIDAEVCRAKCIRDGGCKFWTWGEDGKCGLIRYNYFYVSKLLWFSDKTP